MATDPDTAGDLAALAALEPIDAVGDDSEPSATPPPHWDPDAHAPMLATDPAVVLVEIPGVPTTDLES